MGKQRLGGIYNLLGSLMSMLGTAGQLRSGSLEADSEMLSACPGNLEGDEEGRLGRGVGTQDLVTQMRTQGSAGKLKLARSGHPKLSQSLGMVASGIIHLTLSDQWDKPGWGAVFCTNSISQ